MFIISARLVKLFSFGIANAITLWPFVFMKSADLPDYVRNHEKIHLKQQIELLVIFFYLWYFIEFLIHFIKLKNRDLAYRRISFEREAYENHYNFNYLKERKIFSFIHYIKSKKS